MKRRVLVLIGMYAVGCLIGALIPTNEPVVVDGLVQNSQFLYMQKEEEPIPLEWSAKYKAWIPQNTEAFVPVHGIPIDAEKMRQNNEIIATLTEDIKGALQRYNPGVWYTLDSAYVDTITESVDNPGLYRIAINVNAPDSIERLVFDVSADSQAELIRYSRMRV